MRPSRDNPPSRFPPPRDPAPHDPPPRFPPSGYTRAAPAPPARRGPFRSRSRLPAVAVAAALAAGIVLTLAYGLLRPPPAHRLTPGAVPTTPTRATTPAAPSVPPRPGAPSPPGASTSKAPEAGGGTPVRPRTSGTRGRAEGKAPARPAPRVPRPRPAPRPRSTHRPPAAPRPTPAWITAECARRYPNDATRRAACAAALTRFGGRR